MTSLQSVICARRRADYFADGKMDLMPIRDLVARAAFATGLAFGLMAQSPTRPSSPPSLPVGLEAPADEQRAVPALPPGLGAPLETRTKSVDTEPGFAPPFGLTGFIEARIGSRIVDDGTQKSLSIAETRLQLERDFFTPHAAFRFVGDFVLDGVEDDRAVDLQSGRGFFDLREANAVAQPLSFLDAKAGRQILTWGVGDLVFINDLFPKDFRAFFIGRDDEYLKAPSDAFRLSAYSDVANLDVVYTPRFNSDRFIDGSRLSYFGPSQGSIVGRNPIITADTPHTWFSDDEVAARLHQNVSGWELAAYGYHGFWKTPEGARADGTPFHPRLSVIGASARGPLEGGIVTGEVGHYFSHDDASGNDALIRNSETRLLVGYEREIATELTATGQYYVEILSDFSRLNQNLTPGQTAPDRARHVLTLRVTQLLFNQNLMLSAFNFWSPNEEDGHLRFRATYKLSDTWKIEGGGNLFYGREENTFFGQLQDNTNLFVAIRRSF